MAMGSILAPGIGSQASNGPSAGRAAPPPRSEYAGDQACAECHRKQADSYGLTPHARDSAPAERAHILGSFTGTNNVLHTTNPHLIVAMTKEKTGYYESGIDISNPNHPTGEAERIDIVIGSGRHAQTYLYWNGDQLFEMPVSYWGWGREWVLSPGFPPDQVHFDRPVVPRCLECHGSYFTWLNPPANRYAKDSIVLGIECERCHGPGAKHVALEQPGSGPHSGTETAIVNPARLSHRQQLDLCSLCHAGAVLPIGNSLRYLPGDNVRDYLEIQPLDPAAPADVHGNQAGALEASRCFSSGEMTCSTCHDVHQIQEKANAFSERCQTCHDERACGKYKTMGEAIRTRCVACHMPLQDSNKIVSAAGQQRLHALLRSHRIAVYRDASADVERGLKRQAN